MGLAEALGQIQRGAKGQGAGEAGVGFLAVLGGVERHQGLGQGVEGDRVGWGRVRRLAQMGQGALRVIAHQVRLAKGPEGVGGPGDRARDCDTRALTCARSSATARSSNHRASTSSHRLLITIPSWVRLSTSSGWSWRVASSRGMDRDRMNSQEAPRQPHPVAVRFYVRLRCTDDQRIGH